MYDPLKGADTMIFERLGDTPASREYLDATLDHLEEFAQSGLRTLCLAMRDIGATQYENWNKIYQGWDHKSKLSVLKPDFIKFHQICN